MKLSAFVVCSRGIIQGLIWNVRLHNENVLACFPDFVYICKESEIHFPFGLQLDQWLPAYFKADSFCGIDSAWSCLGITMPEALFVVFGMYGIFILLYAASWIRSAKERVIANRLNHRPRRW